MQTFKPFLTVPYQGKPASHPKCIFYGQLLVETRAPKLDFAKEVANAVIVQGELNKASLDYNPNEKHFVTRREGKENVLDFEGEVSAYLKLPQEDARSLHVSFREAEEGDKVKEVVEKAKLTPSYVLTLSVEASQHGEFSEPGFWKQLENNLFCGLSEPDPERGRAGDPEIKIAIVYGVEEAYWIIPNMR